MYANTVLPIFPVQYTVDDIDINQLIFILTSCKSQLSNLWIIIYDYLYIYNTWSCYAAKSLCLCVCVSVPNNRVYDGPLAAAASTTENPMHHLGKMKTNSGDTRGYRGISRNTRGHQGIPTVPGDTRGLFPSLVHGFAGQKLAQLIIQGSGRKKCNGKWLASP